MLSTMSSSPAGAPVGGGASGASMIHLANVSAQYGDTFFDSPGGVGGHESSGSDAGSSHDLGGAKSGKSSPAPESKSTKKKSCPKQHQLPMFLSKTYHMIDRCDGTIATWSDVGDNFVIKNVESFASSVLPQYFKHSNFSSFARQLNFYGFRKLKAEPILTADFDARTASHVRFYHEKFQKDRPDLLQQIKRATKSDQQSKDDVESLKTEIVHLKECMSTMSADCDRKIAEITFDFNRRFTAMAAEYEKLAALVQHCSNKTGVAPSSSTMQGGAAIAQGTSPDMMQSLSHVAGMRLQNSPSVRPIPSPAAGQNMSPLSGEKRGAEEDPNKPQSRQRTS